MQIRRGVILVTALTTTEENQLKGHSDQTLKTQLTFANVIYPSQTPQSKETEITASLRLHQRVKATRTP